MAYEDRASIEVTPPSEHSQAWAARLEGESPVHPAELLGVARGDTVLAVVAHPDDETLAMGATLAALSAVGVRVRLVVLSSGEAALDHVGRKVQGLAGRRTVELAAACEALGVFLTDVGTWPDGRLREAFTEIEERLNRLVADVRPSALVTLWGDDPHPDHRAVASVSEAVGAEYGVMVACMPLWALHWTDPAGVTAPVRRVGAPPAAAVAKARAVAAYESQIAPLAPDLQAIVPAAVVAFPYECMVVE